MNNTYLKERVATADELQWLKEQYDTSVKKISKQSTYYAIGYLAFSFLPVGLVTERVRHVKEHGFDTIIDALGFKGWLGMTAGVALIGAYLILSDWYIAGRKKDLKEKIMVLRKTPIHDTLNEGAERRFRCDGPKPNEYLYETKTGLRIFDGMSLELEYFKYSGEIISVVESAHEHEETLKKLV